METCESWGGWGGVLRKETVSGSWGRRAARPRWAVWGKLILGQDVAWACSRRWGASRRWPFDLTTNGLFSISKTGPALGSQGGKVARHRGLSAWFQGGGFADQLCAHEERSQVPGFGSLTLFCPQTQELMPTSKAASSQPGPVSDGASDPLSGVPAAMLQNTWSLLGPRDASRALGICRELSPPSSPCRREGTWWCQ